MSDTGFAFINKTRKRISSSHFKSIKETVLTNKYTLSVVVVSKGVSRQLNRKYRKKDKPTNVLSFPLSKNEGEIFLDADTIQKETKKFDRNFDNLLTFLFIHGLFHLKGFKHGVTMERRETAIRRKFKI